jgi:hypothetical protein
MPLRRTAVLAGFLVFVLRLSLPAFSSISLGSPTGSAQDDNFTLEGKITEKSANQLTISTGGNIIFHVSFDDKTEIKKKDGSPGAAQDLHTGLKVSVVGELTESGIIKARKIAIEPEGSENKSAG